MSSLNSKRVCQLSQNPTSIEEVVAAWKKVQVQAKQWAEKRSKAVEKAEVEIDLDLIQFVDDANKLTEKLAVAMKDQCLPIEDKSLSKMDVVMNIISACVPTTAFIAGDSHFGKNKEDFIKDIQSLIDSALRKVEKVAKDLLTLKQSDTQTDRSSSNRSKRLKVK
jgi:hypothetical protein